MKTDKVTKLLLCIIALNLSVIAFRDIGIVPQVLAAEGNSPTAKYGLVPINADGTITVKIESSDPMEVNVTQVGGIPVAGDFYVRAHEPLEVKIVR